MGCDYYIIKALRIYYNENENDYLQVELDRERGYYFDIESDEDADDYETKVEEYIRERLTPKMAPIIIYHNGVFNKSGSETKYKSMIEKRMNSAGKTWSEVIKVVKVEYRYERT